MTKASPPTSRRRPRVSHTAAERRARGMLAVFDETRWLFHLISALAERVHGQGSVTAGRRGILLDLARNGPQTVPEMARARPVSRQHIQMLVNDLRDDGLVELAANPAHRRSSFVCLTAKGSALIERMGAREVEILGRMPLDLSADELEQAALVLRRLRRALGRPGTTAKERRP